MEPLTLRELANAKFQRWLMHFLWWYMKRRMDAGSHNSEAMGLDKDGHRMLLRFDDVTAEDDWRRRADDE